VSGLSLIALRERRCWMFDMDGTLTMPVHDFDAMRRELGLPQGIGTLEGLAALPPELQAERRELLNEIGWRYALQAQPQPGAPELLAALAARGARLGIITRNARRNTEETLRRIGCARWFAPEDIATRDEGEPKPAPEAVLRLLSRWGEAPGSGVVIGDAIYDLQAGRAAGAATVLLDPSGSAPHRPLADCCVERLDDLRALLA
jgi:HAD superfamily hydrolase (TIGR01509 family)